MENYSYNNHYSTQGPQLPPELPPNSRTGVLPPGWTNWIIWSVVSIVIGVFTSTLIGIILGIIGLFKAKEANDAARYGDPRAQELNDSARLWTLLALGVEALLVVFSTIAIILLILLYLFFIFFMVGTSAGVAALN